MHIRIAALAVFSALAAIDPAAALAQSSQSPAPAASAAPAAAPQIPPNSLIFFGPDGSLMSAKWHNIKVWLRYCDGLDKPFLKPAFPMVFDLGSDPSERNNMFSDKMDIGWEVAFVLPAVFEYEKSLAQYPNIKPGEEFTGYKTAAK